MNDQSPVRPLYVKPRRAAALLDCSERTVRQLAAEGVLSKVYIGRMVRYNIGEIEALMESRTPPRKRAAVEQVG